MPKRFSLVPVGTVDYVSLIRHPHPVAHIVTQIAPEILSAHELSLQESLDPEDPELDNSPGGYGAEVDHWSLGVMLYEVRAISAPF